MPQATKAPTAVGLYLAGVQFLFALGWIVYVIYLPALAEQAGLPRSAVPWLLLLDQIVFVACDLVVGVWSDRAATVLGRLGAAVVGVTLLSSLAFLALPWVAPQGSPALFIAVTVLWVASSSVLRAPPLTLLGRYVHKPALPWMVSLVLLGTGVASAVGPYLGLRLTAVDPRLPFALAAVSLVALTAGMVLAERALAAGRAQGAGATGPAALAGAPGPAPAGAPPVQAGVAASGMGHPAAPLSPAAVAPFLLAALLCAAAAQLHASVVSAPVFLRHVTAADLPTLMPVFWAGFNVALMPASLAVRRWGALRVMAAGLLLAALGSLGAWAAGSLAATVVCQCLAGAGWGIGLLSGFTAAVRFGQVGREGAMSGALNAALAAAAFSRIALVTLVAPAPVLAAQWGWTPALLFALGAVLLWGVAVRGRTA